MEREGKGQTGMLGREMRNRKGRKEGYERKLMEKKGRGGRERRGKKRDEDEVMESTKRQGCWENEMRERK